MNIPKDNQASCSSEPGSLDGKKVSGFVINAFTRHDVWDGDFSVASYNLASLVGAPWKVKGDFLCSDNPLASLEGAPSVVEGSVYCRNLPNLKSLSGIHLIFKEIGGGIYIDDVPNLLGHCLIKGLKFVVVGDNETGTQADAHCRKIGRILDAHLDSGRAGMVDCYDELMEAGLDAYAQL